MDLILAQKMQRMEKYKSKERYTYRDDNQHRIAPGQSNQ